MECSSSVEGVSTNGADDLDCTAKIQELFKMLCAADSHDKILNKIEVISCRNGTLLAELVIHPEHTNAYGFLHGGFTATLIDMCTSVAMGTYSTPGHGVPVDLNISYINPGKLNDRIEIEAKTIKVGRTLGFAEAVIRSKSTGKIIAKGSHTKHVMNSEQYSLTIQS